MYTIKQAISTAYKWFVIPLAIVLAFVAVGFAHAANFFKWSVRLLKVTEPGYSCGIGFPEATYVRRDSYKFVTVEVGGFSLPSKNPELLQQLSCQIYELVDQFVTKAEGRYIDLDNVTLHELTQLANGLPIELRGANPHLGDLKVSDIVSHTAMLLDEASQYESDYVTASPQDQQDPYVDPESVKFTGPDETVDPPNLSPTFSVTPSDQQILSDDELSHESEQPKPALVPGS